MRIDLELDTDAYIALLQERGWNVGVGSYYALEVKVKKAMQEFLQRQIEDQVEWYVEHIEEDLNLPKMSEDEPPVRKDQRAVRPYKVIRVEAKE
jgi:hypothetical protein